RAGDSQALYRQRAGDQP
ncbi:hypothetical protein BN1708_019488, partial [Verticillium longisporum]